MTNVGAMHRFAGLLRRHGLTLLLTSAMVALYMGQTIPALKERAALRDRRVAAEIELADKKRQLAEGLLWLRGAAEDPFVRERFRDAYTRSPDVTGPRVVVALPESGEAGSGSAEQDP